MAISQKGLSELTGSGEPIGGSTERVFSQELALAIVDHIWLLAIGPIVVALVAYLAASLAPHQYRSSALLRIDRATAKSMEQFVTSPPVANQILSKHGVGGDLPDAQASFLAHHFGLIDPEPTSWRAGDRLYRLDVNDSDPRRAQAIATDLIQTWLASTHPQGKARAFLEALLERNRIAANEKTKLIDQLESETAKLVAPSGASGEPASYLSVVIGRGENWAAVDRLIARLKGVTADVVVVPPNLPQAAMPTRARGIAVLFGVAALPLLLVLVLLGRYLAPGRSPYQPLRRFRPMA
ncbi:hypothetical protein JQ594_23265 [Bradyrhizobium manausense]|uniref:hypothetical protein n=1 Tax=Bradyrhizobium manausense TaxID=989370 RepID=UPI001BA57EE9|nr:hypothetical protein [Bradyrhizobium manausense]MBR0688863.1 hypothetical protein [Bradyrhizobium manausense]